MTVSAPLAEALDAALTVAPPAAEAILADAQAQLAHLGRLGPDPDLSELAPQQDPGDTPLLSTPHTASTYPALLWNGERFERLSAPWAARLAFLARVAAGDAAEPVRLARAVWAGEVVRRLWPPAPEGPARAGLTTDSVAAGACAAVASGIEGDELAAVAELAAGLMLVTPVDVGAGAPAGATPHLAGLAAGHCLAAGWLAVQLFRCGVLAAPGTALEVLATREAP
ncbi:MAG TPA: hypothetical protein VFJ94_16350 [Intrasporangium sp.]|uniref:hypothetical protein n=1 Tax=Intrasporangium sp. TaxID=1925024 RepID=UPI002D78B858|nr:hypothetical protein [Intrasporangium sp.]HET7400087.1 hypothetical protein [Intrasporangium sp.]